MASGKSTLFLGDLSAFCNEEDVHAIFSPFGEVVEIKIMRSEETLRNLSYGFIKFSNPADAKKAMNALDGTLFCGRHLRVGWASFRSKKEPKPPQHHDRIESASVHISYISYQLRTLVTEESLRILFSTYGVVLDCSIKKSYVDHAINRQCGYGFIHYASTPEGVESALAAVTGLNDSTLNDVCYKCSVSHNLEKQLMSNNSSKTPSGATTPIPGPAPNTPTPNQQHFPHFSQSNSILKSTVSGTSAGAGSTDTTSERIATNNNAANINAFPRPAAHSMPMKVRAGMSLSHPSSTSMADNSAAASPMSWSPAPGFYNSHHQQYQSHQQQQSRISSNIKLEENRQAAFQRRNDEAMYFSNMMEREFSGRLPSHVNTSWSIGVGDGANSNVNILHQSNFQSNSSSMIGSQCTSPTNSYSNSVSTNAAPIQGSSRLPAATFFIEHNPFFSQHSHQHLQSSRHQELPQNHHFSSQQQQYPPIFHFDKNETSRHPSTSSSAPSFLNKSDDTKTNTVFVAASAIFGANVHHTDKSNICLTDLNANTLPVFNNDSVSCSSSSAAYSLFSDTTVTAMAPVHASSATSEQMPHDELFSISSSALPAYFYDSLLNLSAAEDRSDIDYDSLYEQSSTRSIIPKQFAFHELSMRDSLSNHAGKNIESKFYGKRDESHTWVPPMEFFDTINLNHENNIDSDKRNYSEVTSPNCNTFSSL